MKDTFFYYLQDKRALAAVLALLLATIGLSFLLLSTVPVIQEALPPEEGELDLRGKHLTVDQYLRLQETNPDREIRWNVPVGSETFDSYSETLTLQDYTAADREMLDYFPRLKSLNASGSTDYDALVSLWEESPGYEVFWSVPLGRRTVSSNVESLVLKSGEQGADELREAVSRLPALKTVSISDCTYTDKEKQELKDAFDHVVFRWPIEVCGEKFFSTVKEISFAGREDLDQASLRQIQKKAPLFYDLESIDLTDCGFEGEELHKLDEKLPDTDVVWTFDLYGFKICSTDEEIDISGKIIQDKAKALESIIPWMSHLKKVVMCEVGINDKDMNALNQKYLPQGIRIVWLVHIKWAGIRTDATSFIPYAESGAKQFANVVGLDALQYCPDLIALDIGHSNIKDLSYLLIMPHLKYLILADNWVGDITEVGTLKELTWLELFKTGISDISPLLGCTSLEHLNICYIIAPGDHLYETLRQMKSLKRLWCCGTQMTPEQVEALREELPDCEIWDKMGDESTGSTWRYDDAYYEMRDAFHMYYMSIKGNTVPRLSEEEIQEMHKKYWGY